MRFLRITIENFLAYSTSQTLSLARRGLVLIEGQNQDDASALSNGAGKSSVFEALVWCLYGRTIRGLKGDDVVHLYTGHDCRVRLKMKGENGVIYYLTRYRKHRKMKNGLELMTKAGVRLTGVSVEETQEKVNALVGLDFTAFTGVLCGQGVLAPFSSLRDSDAKPIVEKVVGLTLYSEAGSHTSEKLSGLAMTIDMTKRQLDTAQVKKQHTASVVKTAKEMLARAKSEQAKMRKQVNGDIKAAKLEVSTLESEIEESEAAEREEKKVKAKEEKAETIQRKCEEVYIKSNVLVAHLEKDLAEHLKHRGQKGICQSCGGKIEPQNVENIIRRTELMLKRAKDDQQNKGQVLGQAQKTLLEWKQEAKKHHIASGSLSYLKKQLTTKNNVLASLQERLKNVEKHGDRVKQELAAAKKDHEKAEQAVCDLREELRKYTEEESVLEFWRSGFGNKGLKSLVLDSQLPFLNQRAERYSRILTDGNIKVKFRTQTLLKSGDETDRFGVDVINKYGGKQYAANSGGEQGKVDLIVGLSFLALLNARSQSKLNVIFLDEPFESLDPEGFDRVLTILTEEMGQYESVFVVTHREELKDFFSHTINVVKKGKSSRIVD